MAENTIFDDVFRTTIEKMPELAIPLINEVFGTDYLQDTKIVQGRNEHLTPNGKKITDSYMVIGNRQYHLECQSTEDSTMILRMVEYNFAIGLENAEKVQGTYRIQFPHSCILYLRGDDQRKAIGIKLLFPDNQMVEYKVPIVRMEWYSIEEVLQKDLLMLLPFYIIRYEKVKQQLEENDTLSKKLFQEYEMIEKYLETKLLKEGKEKEFRDIRELISRITDYIFSESEKIRKGMDEIMGGQVLELESDKLIKKGEEIGIGDMAALTKKLLDDNRMDDLRRCTEDVDFRKKLLHELHA
ncbi:MAG: hypothetical protein ACI4EI_12980 [Muricoprocola sp.]